MSDPAAERPPTKVAWACLEAHRAQDWDRLRTLLHPHARIGTFAGGGRPEDPEVAIARLREVHGDFLYQAKVVNMTELDAQAVVLEGRVQYRRNEGWADTEQTWLYDAREAGVPWRKWGPCLSERQWGTVREVYSDDGNAWDYFSHDHSRSRAY